MSAGHAVPRLPRSSELQQSAVNYSLTLVISMSANRILDNGIPNETPYMHEHLSNHQKFCLIRTDGQSTASNRSISLIDLDLIRRYSGITRRE